jgi:thioredoxin 1
MSTIDLSLEKFESTVQENKIVFIDFWAAWCGPCRVFAPVFEAASEANPEITFAKVDTEAEQQLAGMMGIQSIPTLMIFKENVLIFSQPGALPAAALDELVEAAKNLDMDYVRSEIAKEKAESASAGQTDAVGD